jgi:AcrR family transcriptional regulator
MLSTTTKLTSSTWRSTLCAVATTARPYHHGNLRAALIEAAERALARGGVASLSLRELAREIGVSHAAPRRHFADRQALLDALAEDGFVQLGERMASAIDGAGAGFRPRLVALAKAYVGFAAEHGALLDLMYAGKHAPSADAVRAAAEQAFAAPLALFSEAQAAGEVVAGDVMEVAVVAWAAMHGLADMANNGMLDEASLDDVVTAAAARLVDGLAPR